MHNKTTPNAAAAALTTLMHALIDIECTAELAQGEEQKDRTQFALECIRYIATRSLNDAKNILVATPHCYFHLPLYTLRLFPRTEQNVYAWLSK